MLEPVAQRHDIGDPKRLDHETGKPIFKLDQLGRHPPDLGTGLVDEVGGAQHGLLELCAGTGNRAGRLRARGTRRRRQLLMRRITLLRTHQLPGLLQAADRFLEVLVNVGQQVGSLVA